MLCGRDESEGLGRAVGGPDVVAGLDFAGVDEPCCDSRVTAAAGAGAVGRGGKAIHHGCPACVDEHGCEGREREVE